MAEKELPPQAPPGGSVAEEPPAAGPTARQIYRVVAPRRKWWRWAAAISFGWLVIGIFWIFGDKIDDALKSFGLGDALFLVSIFLPQTATAVALTFPAIAGISILAADRRWGRLEQLALTGLEPQVLLRAYHWRAFMTGFLFLLVLAPCWAYCSRPPLPLTFNGNLFSLFWNAIPRHSVANFCPGLCSDIFSVYLAAAVGVSALALARRRGWAITLSVIFLALAALGGWLGSTVVIRKLAEHQVVLSQYHPPSGRPGFSFGYTQEVEPAYSIFMWGFALVWSALAVLVSELVLRLAARRLDRLVTD